MGRIKVFLVCLIWLKQLTHIKELELAFPQHKFILLILSTSNKVSIFPAFFNKPQKMKHFFVLIFLQIFHYQSAVGFNINPWSGDNQPEIFSWPTYKNPELPPPYQKCSKDSFGQMSSVEVIPCPSTKRCPLVKGSNVTLNLEFIPSFPANRVVGSIAGVFNSYLPSAGFGKPEVNHHHIKKQSNCRELFQIHHIDYHIFFTNPGFVCFKTSRVPRDAWKTL